MIYDSFFGPVAREHGWAPAPRYLLRRALVLEWLGSIPAGRFVEIGCGAGTMSVELARLGWAGLAVDASESAQALAKTLLAPFPAVTVHGAVPADIPAPVDLVMTFEVLEHIEDDYGTLAQWAALLRPGGTMLLSVPAHPSLWNASDEWAGHFRRYTKERLETVAANAGLQVTQLVCYGWPLANVTERARAILHARRVHAKAMDQQAATMRSGVERRAETRMFPLLDSWLGRGGMRLFFMLQRWTLQRPWGTGYLLQARKG